MFRTVSRTCNRTQLKSVAVGKSRHTEREGTLIGFVVVAFWWLRDTQVDTPRWHL